MSRKLYLKRGVVLGYLSAIVLTVTLGILSYLWKERLLETGQYFTHSLQVVTSAERLLVICLDLESGQRGFVIAGSPIFLQQYDSAVKAFEGEMGHLRSLTNGNTVQQLHVAELETHMRDKIARTTRTVEAKKTIGFEAAQAFISVGDGQVITNKVKAKIKDIRQEENRALGEMSTLAGGAFIRFQILFTTLLVIPLAIMVLLFWGTNLHFKRRLAFDSNLLAASREISLLNAELESFTYSVSHDLRAPLRSVNGYAEILREDYSHKLDQEGRRVIEVITRNSKRMGALIDDLLEFSRLGRTELVKSEIKTGQLVQRVIDEHFEHHGPVPVDFRLNELADSYGDQSMILQVWVNLISNAIKYSSKHPHPVVEIGSFDEPEGTGFYVKDNGVGFNMKYVDKLFGVFQRLHKPSEFAGTGVGLALVKRIVVRHEGRVWVDAKPDEGAIFYFTLPKN